MTSSQERITVVTLGGPVLQLINIKMLHSLFKTKIIQELFVFTTTTRDKMR